MACGMPRRRKEERAAKKEQAVRKLEAEMYEALRTRLFEVEHALRIIVEYPKLNVSKSTTKEATEWMKGWTDAMKQGKETLAARSLFLEIADGLVEISRKRSG